MTAETEALVVALEAKDDAKEAGADAKEAIVKAKEAGAKADRAIAIAERSEASVAGLSHAVRRTESKLDDLSVRSDTQHTETIQAIDSSKLALREREKADLLHEEKILSLTATVSKLSNGDVAKIGGAAAAGVGALFLAIAALINAVAPVAPAILAQRYAVPLPPVVVTVAAPPVAPPAVSK